MTEQCHCYGLTASVYAESTLIYILNKDIFVAVGAHYVRLVSKIIHQLNFQGSEENTK